MLAARDERDVIDAVAQAAADGGRVEIVGGGSKRDAGAPDRAATLLDCRALAGVIDYDPPELVLTLRPGTPLGEVEALVAAQGQMLAFDPFDHGPIFGKPVGAGTIGGAVIAGVSGSQRVSQGSARDHLLGVRMVSGRGEAFVGGAKVVKNVTGYDLPKLMAGSWGRLGVLTELTLKVMPRPEARATRIVEGLDPREAMAAIARALGSQAEIAAAAYLPAHITSGASITALRVQGFAPAVAARCAMIDGLIEGAHEAGEDIWESFRTLSPLAGDAPLWRIIVPPSGFPSVVAALEPLGADWMADWGGGLIWMAFDGAAALVRDAAQKAGGSATLLRAPAGMRARVPMLHPAARPLQALEERVRRAFDPAGLFETGRFLDYPHAD